jgi:hypothetical protein
MAAGICSSLIQLTPPKIEMRPEVSSDQIIARATEIVNAICYILANINLTVWICNLVNDFHGRKVA